MKPRQLEAFDWRTFALEHDGPDSDRAERENIGGRWCEVRVRVQYTAATRSGRWQARARIEACLIATASASTIRAMRARCRELLEGCGEGCIDYYADSTYITAVKAMGPNEISLREQRAS